MSTDLREWLAALPKVELHLHLEGAIPLAALWELVVKYGGDQEVSNIGALRGKFTYRDFPHFIETWVWKNGFLREYEDFTFIAESVARDLASQNIRYVEAFFSPRDFERHGLAAQELTVAIRKGLDRVQEITVGLVPDLIRDFGPEKGAETLREVYEVRDHGVLGIGIGGSEHDFPPEAFRDVYEEARELGFHTSAHAGEAAGADSVWGVLRDLRADRIGHGTRAIEDDALVEYLVETQTPIELCPLSNVATGVIDAYDQHPVRTYFDRGVNVCVNTDDPRMFHNSFVDELAGLIETFSFTPDEIRRLLLNGVSASWLPDERKRQLAHEFQADPAWNGPHNG